MTRWVRSLRPPKRPVDPWRPVGSCWEDERTPAGPLPVLTVFLAGAECPFTCVFCDLWRDTLDRPTPLGTVPAQLSAALQAAMPLPELAGIKLYNAGNFFDPRAVPPAEDSALAELLAPFVRVTVECHPRLVGRRCFAFGERVGGRLEVAMGLETIHPAALPRLNKEMTLRDFERAAARLVNHGIALRAFVLLAPPFVPPAEAVEWAVRSAAHAIDRGAHGVVSAGFVVEAGDAWRSLSALAPEQAWRVLLDRYPTLAAQFGEARAVQPIGIVPRLQRRLERSAGPNWALLPHGFCFLSPLFSTGIAWSLLGVERLALVLEPAAGGGANRAGLEPGLARYATLLETEADHLEQLVGGAYRARHDFDAFCAHSYLYFAAVSYAEARQRLLPPPAAVGAWAGDGFAGGSDPVIREAVAQAGALLTRLPAGRDPRFAEEYFQAVRRVIASRNVAGLADPARRRLYPVDLDALVAAAPLLGLGPDEIRLALPRLRGAGEAGSLLLPRRHTGVARA